MIQRIFHPIGQGAFYSERHDGFNIVYDCGELSNSKRSQRLVENSFSEDESIDILFISHFDADHVNRIEYLKKINIKRVIMPLLHDNEKVFLNHFYKAIGKDEIIQIIEEPNTFFGVNTDIIYVRDNDESNNDTTYGIPVEQLKDGDEISSGIRISINADWVFVPNNNRLATQKTVLEKKFRDKKLDFEKFKISLEYTLKNSSQIRKIYNELAGGINANSMTLYSGPVVKGYVIEDCICCFKTFNHAGCIYTGDVDLNDINIDSIYSKYWSLVGTIQVPHHGSKHSFNKTPFKSKDYMCPVSYGNSNIYDHPSLDVLTQLSAESCYVKHVTENVDTTYIQNIIKL
ncbi:MAG: hypothetical protein RIS29_2141 [Bacteroidota bacterium]|jgi:beta-lactamase superfamily II metal-dependent hydrolase